MLRKWPLHPFLVALYPPPPLALLPGENYLLPHARPYNFLNVTERVRTDPRSP